MTDRTQTITVSLKKPMRVDDAERLIWAIECLSNVAKATAEVVPLTWGETAAVERKIAEELIDLAGKVSRGEVR